jgi:Domain of unknown function (DUF4263)
MIEHFDSEAINYSGILVIGRDEGLTQLDKRRLEWRQDKVIINSKKIFCVTYDQLYRDLSGRLDNIKGIEINKF